MIPILIYLIMTILVGGVATWFDDDSLGGLIIGLAWPAVLPIALIVGAMRLVATLLDKVF